MHCHAEALEDFLLNFLEVGHDDAGKTVTKPKYMEMLVRRARQHAHQLQFECGRKRADRFASAQTHLLAARHCQSATQHPGG